MLHHRHFLHVIDHFLLRSLWAGRRDVLGTIDIQGPDDGRERRLGLRLGRRVDGVRPHDKSGVIRIPEHASRVIGNDVCASELSVDLQGDVREVCARGGSTITIGTLIFLYMWISRIDEGGLKHSNHHALRRDTSANITKARILINVPWG